MANSTSKSDVVRRFINEVWNEGKQSTIDELYAPHGVAEGLGQEHRNGPEEFKMFHQLITSTCNNINMDIKDMMEDGDRVSYRAVMNMTHKQTGKPISFEGGGFGVIENGKIVEAYNSWNFLDMLVQIGAVSADILPRALLESK